MIYRSRRISQIPAVRFTVVLAVLCGVFSVVGFFSYQFNEFLYRIPYGNYLPIITSIVSVFLFAFLYLQSGSGISESSHGSAYIAPEALDDMFEEIRYHRNDVSANIESLNARVNNLDAFQRLTDSERHLVIEDIVRSSGAEAIKDIFVEEARLFKSQLTDQIGLERLTSFSRNSVERLKREISDLRLRSNINLLIGMLITAGGLWLLWSTVSMLDASDLLKALASEGQESNNKFFKNLILPVIPRVMLVVFVEVFAYFFLRLYRNGLSEIKYFQNELTNIESKLTAAEFAFVTKNEDALKLAIESLSRTERNFVLEKGQTTVELERAKADSQFSKELVKLIPSLLDRKK